MKKIEPEYFFWEQIYNTMLNYSLTYTGVLVSVLGMLASSLGLDLGNETLTSFVVVLMQFGGAILALIGRWRAGGISVFGVKK